VIVTYSQIEATGNGSNWEEMDLTNVSWLNCYVYIHVVVINETHEALSAVPVPVGGNRVMVAEPGCL
jgi:hypothetical protein